ncbi:hypothetical protein KA005_53480 [bacterium]|nr:hypothetical protein [bacterium]
MTSDIIGIHETNGYHFYLLRGLLRIKADMSIVYPIEAVKDRVDRELVVPRILMEDLGKALLKMLKDDSTGSPAALLTILRGKILEDVSPELRKDIEGWLVLYDL